PQAGVGACFVLVSGRGREAGWHRLVQSAGYKGGAVAPTAGVKPRTMAEDANTVPDPHAWQDLSNGRLYVANVASALAAADPRDAEDFRKAAVAYTATIDGKDKWVRAELTTVPAGQRKVITSHDAFGYFGAAYGITFLAPEGVSTEAEPSAAAIARLVQQMRSEGIRIVFFENMASPKLVEALAADAGAKVGGTLYSDALSPPAGPADSYLKMFDNNVPQLKAAMLGM